MATDTTLRPAGHLNQAKTSGDSMPDSAKIPPVDQAATSRREGTKLHESLDGARSRFAKLLRTRITETERTLAALQAELKAIAGSSMPTVRQARTCATCGKKGHTRRGCPDRPAGKPQKNVKTALTAPPTA